MRLLARLLLFYWWATIAVMVVTVLLVIPSPAAAVFAVMIIPFYGLLQAIPVFAITIMVVIGLGLSGQSRHIWFGITMTAVVLTAGYGLAYVFERHLWAWGINLPEPLVVFRDLAGWVTWGDGVLVGVALIVWPVMTLFSAVILSEGLKSDPFKPVKDQ